MSSDFAAAGGSSQVSFDDEPLLLVDAADEVIGELGKRECHVGDGILHRAFSVFVFNRDGEVLLQQRAPGKMLWGGYWSNTCCSHPRVGEDDEMAVHRRLGQELGISAALLYHYKFIYKAAFADEQGRHVGTEHELCWVWSGVTADPVRPNPHEIAAWRYVSPVALDEELAATPDAFTPWMKMEWQRLRQEGAVPPPEVRRTD